MQKLRQEINGFQQHDGESLFEAWERYKDLLRRCPQHGLAQWLEVPTFYNGLKENIRQHVDSSSGGSMANKTPEEAWALIEEMAVNNCQWNTRGKQQQKAGIYEIDALTALAAQVATLSKKFDSLSTQVKQPLVNCMTCGGEHLTADCALVVCSTSGPSEHVDYIGGNRPQGNPYSNQYNPGWRNHPNFSWKDQGQQQQQRQTQQPGVTEKSSLDDLIMKFMKASNEKFMSHDTLLRNQHASLQNLETQMGQISKLLSERQHGSLPSNTEVNPREHVQAITLRSGREIENRTSPRPTLVPTPEPEKPVEGECATKTPVREYQPQIPYPARLREAEKDEQFKRFLDLFKQLRINLPFVEALAQMPKYAKFLKDLLTNKKKLGDVSTATLSGECSAILQNHLPKKVGDPGSFTIPCMIGDSIMEGALADLGASVNVMPYKTFKRLGLGEPSKSNMTIQLADRTVRRPRGVVEDLLVKVHTFIFPVDFVILDVDDNVDVPLILGRPFLATSQAVIDVKGGKLKLSVGDESVTFNLDKAMKQPSTEDDECFVLDMIDNVVSDFVQETFVVGPTNGDPFLEDEQCTEEREVSLVEIQPIESLAWSGPNESRTDSRPLVGLAQESSDEFPHELIQFGDITPHNFIVEMKPNDNEDSEKSFIFEPP